MKTATHLVTGATGIGLQTPQVHGRGESKATAATGQAWVQYGWG